jgi:hypothetical protein
VPALLNRYRTALRDSEKTRVTHVAVSDDSVAFSGTQTQVNPTGGATVVVIKAATKTDVDFATFDATISVGSADATLAGKSIRTISACDGSATTNALSRSVRSQGIGIETSGDSFVIGVRLANSDATP